MSFELNVSALFLSRHPPRLTFAFSVFRFIACSTARKCTLFNHTHPEAATCCRRTTNKNTLGTKYRININNNRKISKNVLDGDGERLAGLDLYHVYTTNTKVIYSVSTEIFSNKFPCARSHFHYGWPSSETVGGWHLQYLYIQI